MCKHTTTPLRKYSVQAKVADNMDFACSTLTLYPTPQALIPAIPAAPSEVRGVRSPLRGLRRPEGC